MSSNHVDLSVAKIREIFENAAARIEQMRSGEKIAATKLANDVGNDVGISGPTLYPTLKFLFEGYPGVEVKRGAKGGITKL
jgi:hypothetical protein